MLGQYLFCDLFLPCSACLSPASPRERACSGPPGLGEPDKHLGGPPAPAAAAGIGWFSSVGDSPLGLGHDDRVGRRHRAAAAAGRTR